MENAVNDPFTNDLAPLPEKPQFLRILCILSFISCGLLILLFGFLSLLLGLSDVMANEYWDTIIKTQPAFENINAVDFFHEVGMYSVYNLIANSVSLIGVILMWRLNKIGFFIYAAAELAVHFFDLNIHLDANGAAETRSSLGLVFGIFVDSIFIVLYAVNLKYMKKTPVAQA